MDLAKLQRQLIRDEDERLKPYLDSVGKTTIGVGRNLDDVGISKEESRIMLNNDIARVIGQMIRYSWFRDQTAPRKRALANMCFNLGLPKLLMFKKMIAALKVRDFDKASAEALDSKWARQVGNRAIRIAETIKTGKD